MPDRRLDPGPGAPARAGGAGQVRARIQFPARHHRGTGRAGRRRRPRPSDAVLAGAFLAPRLAPRGEKLHRALSVLDAGRIDRRHQRPAVRNRLGHGERQGIPRRAARGLSRAAGNRWIGIYSGLRFANLTTLPHFSISVAMNFWKSAGEPVITMAPKSASLPLSAGSASAALVSRLSLSTISAGVPAGAPMPAHDTAS